MKNWVRDVPDYPRKGIIFKDMTPLLAYPPAFKFAVETFAKILEPLNPEVICALDARGFLFGAPVAVMMGLPLVPIRKHGKLPPEVIGSDYKMEYGNARLEMETDSIRNMERVVILDDLLATGGTAGAAAEIARAAGGNVVCFAFVVELLPLMGRKNLPDSEVISIVKY